MQTETNRHGLSRYIPPNIKRTIRKQCGFGCVVCGVAFSMNTSILNSAMQKSMIQIKWNCYVGAVTEYAINY